MRRRAKQIEALSDQDTMVLTLIKDWLLEVARKELDHRRDKTTGTHFTACTVLARYIIIRVGMPKLSRCGARGRAGPGESPHLTLVGIINMALLRYKTKRFSEAEPLLYVECLEKRRAVLGENHSDALRSMNNLACSAI